MAAIDLFFWVFGGLLSVIVVYLYFLAVMGFLPRKRVVGPQEPQTRFAILIPAHNEAGVIKETLESIGCVSYPAALYEVLVIADNCTDETPDVVRQYGVKCLERTDKQRKGKGFALQWAFERLKENKDFESFDAFIIIDADTVMESDFLQAMDARIGRGEAAIQGYYDVLSPESSPMGSLSYLGFVLSRKLRYEGRTRMRWSSNLLGNGMCFSREVISRFGWGATSIVEDMEYAVILHLNGVKVSFAPEARVLAEIPKTFKDSKIQRSRWDIGRFQIRNKYVIQLLKEAVRQKDVSYLDTAMELLIPPFSLFVALCFAMFGLFLASSFTGFNILSTIWFAIVVALLGYILTGLIVAKAGWKVYRNIIYAPFFMIWRVSTVIWGYVFKIGKQWIKTTRKDIL